MDAEKTPDQLAWEELAKFAISTDFFVPDIIFERLPQLLKDSCKTFLDKRERDIFLLGSLTMLGGCFHNLIAYNEVDNIGLNCNLVSFIIAPPASGKGALKYVKKMAASTVDHYLENPESKSKGVKRKLVIPANSSSSGLLQLLSQNDGIGIMLEPEMETLINANKQDWGNYSDILRNTFDNDSYTLYRKTNNEYVHIPKLRLSLILTGTPDQFKMLMRSPENGLFSRGCYYVFDDNEVELKSFGRFQSDGSLDKKFITFSNDLLECYLASTNEEEIQVRFNNKQLQGIQDYLQGKFVNIFEEKGLHATIKRSFTIIQKIAAILDHLYSWEAEKSFENIKQCRDFSINMAIVINMVYLKHAELAFDLLPLKGDSSIKVGIIQKKLMELLPEEFDRAQAVEFARSLSVHEKTIDNALFKLLQSEKIQKIRHGWYKKNEV